MEKIITNTFEETQNAGAEFARQILRRKTGKRAIVLALNGDLGAGKTTFLQGFAKGLGIHENILSPTFIIMKKFQITNHKSQINSKFKIQKPRPYKYFYHIDCYRLENPEEILHLGFKEIISDPKNIVAIEWPERILEFLPKDITQINFIHSNSTQRLLSIDNH